MPFEGGDKAVDRGVRIEGQVFDGAGDPVPDAILEAFDRDQFARCRTDAEGAFAITVQQTHHLDLFVFARGLLRHLATRVYFPDTSDQLLESIEPERRRTLVATATEGGLRFDIRLQGEGETVFFQV